MKKIFIILSIVIFISVPVTLLAKEKKVALKKTITVTGTVQCNEVAPISRAHVYLVGHSYMAITDDWGNFTFHVVLPGEYLLEVKYGGEILFSESEIIEDASEIDLGVLDLNCGECSTDTDCSENQICESSECQPCACPDVWEPVCGVDDATYNNDCFARCAHVEIVYSGECVGCSVNGTPCDDGDACTTEDTCTDGACVGGVTANCNDDNPCTTDSCNPSVGCVSTNNTDPCDDGDTCTIDDTCSGGACVGTPSAETCNGLDDDCDGQVDEDFPFLGDACDGADSDECTNGTYTCTEDGSSTECINESTTDIAETCNYIDDDCDGQTDEDFSLGNACGVGVCANGTVICSQDGLSTICSTDYLATEETCNGHDDDCDGEIDEGCQ